MGVYTEREEVYRTEEAVEYRFSHIDFRYTPRSGDCNFMMAIVGEGNPVIIPLYIPCVLCDREAAALGEDYYYYYKQQFTAELLSHYPSLSQRSARKVGHTFSKLLERTNAAHNCPSRGPPFRATTTHSVSITVMSPHVEPPAGGVPFLHCRARPATKASIRELLSSSSSSSEASFDAGDCCVICMDAMDTRTTTTLAMPCSHSFHKRCLLQWLDNNHVCPLCRYKLPSSVPH